MPMLSVLALFIDELGAAAIGRLFLWRRASAATQRAQSGVCLPTFRGDLQQFYASPIAELEWTWTHRHRAISDNTHVDDGYFMSPVRSGFAENDKVRVRRWAQERGDLSVIGLGGLVQLGYYWFDGLARSLAKLDIEL